MSKQGQLSRGEAYYKFRDVNGNYPPEFDNESIQSDLKVYTDTLPEVVEVVEKKDKDSKKKGKGA